MKTISEYTELAIPAYALPYLVNGDASGLESDDKRIIGEYMRQYYDEATRVNGSVVFSVDSDENGSSDEYFTWYPEFGLASECEQCTILVLVDDSQNDEVGQ
jgi:hypothetical protein